MIQSVQFEYNLILGIFLGILAAVCLNLGKGVQRIGAETLGKDMIKKWRESPGDRRKIIVWLVGTLMTALAAVLQFAAMLFLDRSSTLVAVSGIGILAVVLFSIYVIHERLNKAQIAGIVTIIVGTALLGLDYTDVPMSPPNMDFLVYAVIVTCIATALVVLVVKTNKWHGIVYGSIAGLFNGFAAIASSFSVSTGDRDLVNSLLNPWLIISIALGQGAFWVTQYAFKKGGSASLVVPAMSSFLIVVPFINDTIIYRIPMGIFQVFAFALNIAGIILLCVSSAAGLNRVLSAAPAQATSNEKKVEA
jgi:drug/metabolite transporter (DMT)-like permease